MSAQSKSSAFLSAKLIWLIFWPQIMCPCWQEHYIRNRNVKKPEQSNKAKYSSQLPCKQFWVPRQVKSKNKHPTLKSEIWHFSLLWLNILNHKSWCITEKTVTVMLWGKWLDFIRENRTEEPEGRFHNRFFFILLFLSPCTFFLFQ